jgi:uncharacterized protein (TIGR03437 family)
MRAPYYLLSLTVFAIFGDVEGQTLLRYLDSSPCCMTKDAAGNVYVASKEVPTPGYQWRTLVTKLDPGLRVVYQFAFPLEASASVSAIAVDNLGNAYVAGTAFYPGQFPLVNPLSGYGASYFLSKLDAAGKKLMFSSGIPLRVLAMTLDSAQNVWLAGYPNNVSSYPTTPGAYNTGGAGGAFIELSAGLDRIVYANQIAGYVDAIRIGDDGAITIAGTTTGSSVGCFVPTSPGAFQAECHSRSRSSPAGFVSRFSGDGKKLIFSSYLNGEEPTAVQGTEVRAMELTRDGGVILAGNTSNPTFPVTPGSASIAASGAFVTKFNVDGSALVYSAIIGGWPTLQGGPLFSFTLDAQERPWLTGITSTSPSFIRYSPLWDLNSGYPDLSGQLPPYRMANGWVTELAADGSSVLLNRTLPNGGGGRDIVISPSGDEILLGSMLFTSPTRVYEGQPGWVGSVLHISADDSIAPAVFGIANAAGYLVSDAVAPGEIVSLYGAGLGPAAGATGDPSSGRIGAILGGTQVLFDDVQAPLLYVASGQINAVVPFGVGRAPSVQVVTQAGSSSPVQLTTVPAAPEVPHYAITKENSGDYYMWATVGDQAAGLNEDGSINGLLNPAPRGSALTLWVSGGGELNPVPADGSILYPPLPAFALPVSVTFGYFAPGAPLGAAEVLYAGPAPGMLAGVLQVNFRIPPNLVTSQSSVQMWPVTIQVGSAASTNVFVAVSYR